MRLLRQTDYIGGDSCFAQGITSFFWSYGCAVCVLILSASADPDQFISKPLMNALPSNRFSPRPARQPQRRSNRLTQRSPRLRQDRHTGVGLEVAIKLGVNVAMAIVALSALARLIPYNLAQTQQLDALQAEVQATQSRVDALQASLEKNFDPQRSRQVMQEQSHLFDPNQKRVIWLRPVPLDSQL